MTEIVLGEVIQGCKVDEAIRVLPTLNRYVGDMSDHHIFRTNQVPYLFLFCGMWPHYHQGTDTPEKLNYGKVEAIARYLDSLTRTVSAREMAGEFEGYDSTAIELRYLKEALSPLFAAMGIPLSLNGRSDIDGLITTVREQFGI